MNVAKATCAPSLPTTDWRAQNWAQIQQWIENASVSDREGIFSLSEKPLSMRVLKGLSGMKGNFHVPFLGEGARVTGHSYPTHMQDIQLLT